MRSTLRNIAATTVSALSLMTSLAVAGEWEDEFPVTQDPVLQFRSYLATAPDDTVHVLWPDWTDFEDTKVTLTSSTDRGATWSEPAIIFEGTAYDSFDLVADGAGLHLILVEFLEDEEEFKHPYYARSNDGGVTFSTPTRIGNRDNIEATRLFSRPGWLYLYASDYGDVETHYLYVSDDGGATWQEKPFLPGFPLLHPTFSIRDGVIHTVFATVTGIRHAWSADDGDTWSTPVDVSSGAGDHSQLPQIAVETAGGIHVVWEDDRGGHFEIYYSRSGDGGATWTDDERLNVTAYGARARILADEEGLHLVWCQYHGDDGWPSSWSSGDFGILWYRFSADAGQTWSDEFRVSQNEDIPNMELPDKGANRVEIAAYSTGFCTLWQDKRDGNFDLYMRNYVVGVCVEDLDESGAVDFGDVLAILAAWGNTGGPEDLDGSGVVDFGDILVVLAAWGPCV